MSPRRPERAALFLALASGLVVLLHLLPTPGSSILGRAVLDAAHAPLFGVFALIVLGVLRGVRPGADAWLVGPYPLALAITAATSAFAESMQHLAHRDAEVTDALRSTAGAAAALLAMAAYDARGRFDRMARRKAQALLALSVGLLLTTSATALCVAGAYVQRWIAFPRICDFQSRWELRFLGTHDATLVLTQLPASWDPSAQERAARVTFERGTYPGFYISEPHADWTGYDRLVFEVYSDLAAAVELVLRIHDTEHDDDYADRFNRSLRIEPGRNHVSIPLADVRGAPSRREMDLSRIAGLALFAVEPPEAFSLYVDALRLERD